MKQTSNPAPSIGPCEGALEPQFCFSAAAGDKVCQGLTPAFSPLSFLSDPLELEQCIAGTGKLNICFSDNFSTFSTLDVCISLGVLVRSFTDF